MEEAAGAEREVVLIARGRGRVSPAAADAGLADIEARAARNWL
ncbi:hypothetical protein ACIB24_10165 [Spongisporangium articulatum]|uniref:Uncharacterized protein n=1 Tax=Spongisporangium articulatum TaxID=3362603 RepID=A0ABW8AM29_9ACTN